MSPPEVPDNDLWWDVVVTMAPTPRVHFRSGCTVYSECLWDGRLVGEGWNTAGFIPVSAGAPDPDLGFSMPGGDAFHLEIDGVLLSNDWRLLRMDTHPLAVGLEAVMELAHGTRQIDVTVHTVVDGTAILRRWLTIYNRGEQPAAVARADPWSGVLWRRTEHEKLGGALEPAEFSLGYFADDRWGHEGRFVTTRIGGTGARVAGRYRAGPHRHPLFTIHAEATGETFIGQLAWSGGYRFDFDVHGPVIESDRAGGDPRRVEFRAGPDAPAPQRVLLPGERVSTPQMHLGCVIGDTDRAVNQMHRHVRRSVPQRDPARIGLVESGIGPEQEMSSEAILHELEVAASLGAEVFFLDASWYTEISSEWYATVGDWSVADRYADGLDPFRTRCRELGMRFGLWMEPERLGAASRAVLEHPEWLARQNNGRPMKGHLDLADEAVCRHVESTIENVIVDNDLDFFRLDYNVGIVGRGFTNEVGGLPENHYWRYYQNVYEMFSRLRRRFPEVIFENCASGGARTDLGMVPLFDHTWVTDWQLAPRSFTITSGMTMALPPELVDRHVGAGMNDHLRGDLDFQCRLALFGRPTVGRFHPLGAAPNEHQLGRVRHMIEIYKQFVRPWQAGCTVFHHSPSATDGRSDWGVLEQSSSDRRHAVLGLFRLGSSGDSEYLARPRGLDAGSSYQVTLDNTAECFEATGSELMQHGLRVRRETALTSELILLSRTGG